MVPLRYERSSDFGFRPFVRDLLRLVLKRRGGFDPGFAERLWNLHQGKWRASPTDHSMLGSFRVGGRQMHVEIRDNPSDLLIFAEVLLREAYAPMLEALEAPIHTFMDVGSHIGLATLYVAAFYPKLQGICVEPVAESATVLRRNLQVNACNMAVVESALGGAPGRSTLFKTRWWSSCTTSLAVARGRLDNPKRPEHTHRDEDLFVDVVTADQLLDQFGLAKLDLMKIDAEGAEAEIFAQPCPWMQNVGRFCLDLHGRYVDTTVAEAVLVEAGFRKVPTRNSRLVVFQR